VQETTAINRLHKVSAIHKLHKPTSDLSMSFLHFFSAA